MTDTGRGFGRAAGPPWSVDVLADLHAGVFNEQEAAEMWPRVNADPQARAIIEALEATTAELSGLASEPAEPIPARVAADLDTALQQEQQRNTANVVGIDVARKRRNRRIGWGAGFLAAAAAVVTAVAVILPQGTEESRPGIAQPDSGSAESTAPSAGEHSADEQPLALSSDNPGSALGEINGVRDFGPFDDEQALKACLEVSGIDPDTAPVGVRPATIDGRHGVVVLYTTGQLAQFRLVAVDADCAPGNPGLLMDEIIGGRGN